MIDLPPLRRALGQLEEGLAEAQANPGHELMRDGVIQRLSPGLLADLKEAFSESALPFKVDVVDGASCDGSFQAVISRETWPARRGGAPRAG